MLSLNYLELEMSRALTTNNRSAMTATWVAFWLLVVGGLSWLLVGVFRVDLVDAIFGTDSMISRLIYVLVGVAALYCAVTLPAPRRPVRIA
jgi:uncharacterized protein